MVRRMDADDLCPCHSADLRRCDSHLPPGGVGARPPSGGGLVLRITLARHTLGRRRVSVLVQPGSEDSRLARACYSLILVLARSRCTPPPLGNHGGWVGHSTTPSA